MYPGRIGEAEAEYAAIKFLLYTLFGSVFIPVAISDPLF
jgi:NADH:ubiquinone oxidoreductase subunit 4 (subunit M)